MRLLGAWLVLVSFAAAFAAADPGTIRSYVGTTTRDPLVGPAVVCDAAGNGVGGVCFFAPFGSGAVTIVVHDANLPDDVNVPLILYAYSGIGPFAVDGEVECPSNHGAVRFAFGPYVDRLVIGVGPWVGAGGVGTPGPVCDGAVGTQGTIEMHLPQPKQ